MKTLSKKDLINTYIENDNGKLLKLYMKACASVDLHVFHDGQEAFDAEFYKGGLFIACNEYSEPDSEGVLQLFMTDEDLGCELTWEKLVEMNIDKVETQTEHQKEMSAFSGEVEWKNGDECLYMNSSEVHKFIGIDPTRNDFCYIKASCAAVNWVEVAKLSKPETPQQREDRERLEAAYDLCITAYPEECTFNEFQAGDIDSINKWLAIVDKTNYRNGVK